MSTEWQVIILDLLLIAAWTSQGFLYAGDFSRWRFWVMGACYFVAAFGLLILLLGDVAVALGYNSDDQWFLRREFRALPWRYAAVIGFWIKALMMRFGKFDAPHKKASG